MAFLKSVLMASTTCVLLASPVLAQTTAPQPKPAPQSTPAKDDDQDSPASQVEDIEVRATSSAPRTSIDSISYSTADDLQASTGTLADALRNIPSVEVDPEGNLSLRGNSSVTVLVDGQPAPMFNGQTRAQVLQQIPANQYERIEVMTNPSAAHSAEGSGGIINLISKKTTQAAAQQAMQLGSLRVNVGEDRYNLGVNFMRNAGKLTLSGNAGIRHDAWKQNGRSTTDFFGSPTRPATQATTLSEVEGTQDNWMLGGNAQYRLSNTLTLSSNLFYIDISNPIYVDSRYEERNGAGTVLNAYDYDGDGEWAGQIGVASLGMVKNFGKPGHEWSTNLNLHRMQSRMGMDLAQLTTAPSPQLSYDRNISKNLSYNWTLTSGYVRPMDDGSKLRTGYELTYADLDADTLAFVGPALDRLTMDPRTTNQFAVQQAVHALYATYERPFGEDFSAQFGLRVEQTDREVQQLTSRETIKWDDLALYPTLHLSYQLNDQQSVRGSYSRRIQRPQPNQLNPYLVRNSATSFSQGNPYLRPQETDSFELMWQKRVQQTFYQATLFYRDASGAFTTVTSELEPGVFLSRPENLGDSRSTGLELVANGPLTPKLRYSASLTYADIEIDATGLPQSRDRSGDSLSGRLTLDWRPTAKDFLQVSGVWGARQIQAQGETETEPMFNLGYRHKINESWSLQLTARDLLDEYGTTTSIITPDFSQTSYNTQGGRSVFVGFTWNFGQGPRREEQFDFSAPSPTN
jgi:outer membrane receptor protein involved in Fe transport